MIMILALLLIAIYWNRTNKEEHHSEALQTVQNQITQLNNLISEPPVMSTLLKQLEQFSQQNGIEIQSIKHAKQRVHLTLHCNEEKLRKFLHYSESFSHHSKLEYLHITKMKHHLRAEIKLSFLNYYRLKEQKRVVTQLSKRLQLKAIVANHVIINEKLLTINEFINGLKLIKIGQNFVVLEDKEQHHILRMYHDIK